MLLKFPPCPLCELQCGSGGPSRLQRQGARAQAQRHVFSKRPLGSSSHGEDQGPVGPFPGCKAFNSRWLEIFNSRWCKIFNSRFGTVGCSSLAFSRIPQIQRCDYETTAPSNKSGARKTRTTSFLDGMQRFLQDADTAWHGNSVSARPQRASEE